MPVAPVQPYDHPLRFLVRSASRPRIVHIVDLAEHGGNGGCSCEQFTIRIRPHLDEGAAPTERHRCKHIRAAREYLADRAIRSIIEHERRMTATR